MPAPTQLDRDLHRQAEDLLPWYATGRLDSADRSLVEAHLLTCARCQRQLAIERRLVEEFQAFAPEVESGWARLRSRIEAPSPTRENWVAAAARDFWQVLRRPAVAALATMQVGFLIVAAALWPSLTQPAYQALGGVPAQASANVIVMFRPDAKEAAIRDALKASGASLVGGPTSADAWLLHVPADARASALAKLRGDDDVTMAEPIDGAAP